MHRNGEIVTRVKEKKKGRRSWHVARNQLFRKKKKKKKEKGIRASWNYSKCPVSFVRLDFSLPCCARGPVFSPLSLSLPFQRFHRRNKSNRIGTTLTATRYTLIFRKNDGRLKSQTTMEFIFFDRDRRIKIYVYFVITKASFPKNLNPKKTPLKERKKNSLIPQITCIEIIIKHPIRYNRIPIPIPIILENSFRNDQRGRRLPDANYNRIFASGDAKKKKRERGKRRKRTAAQPLTVRAPSPPSGAHNSGPLWT